MLRVVSPAVGVVEVVDGPVPEIGIGEALVEMVACGLCGTDLMKVDSSEAKRPFQLGHEVVGRVVAVGEGVAPVAPGLALAAGTRVALAHHVPDYASHFTRRGSATMDPLFMSTNIDPGGFAELIRVPGLHVQHTLRLLPDDVPDLRGVFMEPLACCLRALDRIDLCEGDSVVVAGVGAAGLLFVPLLRDRSVGVIAVDPRPERREAALAWGAERAHDPGDGAFAAEAVAATAGRGADCVILTVLTPALWQQAMAAVRAGGTIVLFGVKPGARHEADFWALWRNEINIVSSYSATPDLLPRALAILRRPGWELERTISHCLPLRDAAQAFQLARSGAASKVVIARE